MNYEIRWSNGYWKLFDTRSYSSIAAYGLRKQADEALECAITGLRIPEGRAWSPYD